MGLGCELHVPKEEEEEKKKNELLASKEVAH